MHPNAQNVIKVMESDILILHVMFVRIKIANIVESILPSVKNANLVLDLIAKCAKIVLNTVWNAMIIIKNVQNVKFLNF